MPNCVALLEQVHHKYGIPVRWPDDPAGWIANSREQEAWVVEGQDKTIVRHVSRCVPTGHPAASLWCEKTGLEESQLAAISRLFIAPDQIRHGHGANLLSTAVERSHELGLQPVLGALADHVEEIDFYKKLGWKSIGNVKDFWISKDEPFELVAMVGPQA